MSERTDHVHDCCYDTQAFDEGRQAGYMAGRRDMEREATGLVCAAVKASGGRISIPMRYIEAGHDMTLIRFDDLANDAVVYEVGRIAPDNRSTKESGCE